MLTDAQVRSDLVEQLPHVAMICQEAPQLFGRDFLHKYLLGIIIKYLRDMDKQASDSTRDLFSHTFSSYSQVIIEVSVVIQT